MHASLAYGAWTSLEPILYYFVYFNSWLIRPMSLVNIIASNLHVAHKSRKFLQTICDIAKDKSTISIQHSAQAGLLIIRTRTVIRQREPSLWLVRRLEMVSRLRWV